MEVPYQKPSVVRRVIACLGGWPWVLTCLAALAAVLLAGYTIILWPEGSYDGRLANLTATLLAVIGYVYFTYRAARPKAWVLLRIRPDLRANPQKGLPALRPEVENRMNRRLDAQITLRMWVDKKPVRHLGEFYRGEQWFPLEPRRAPTGVVRLWKDLEWSADGDETWRSIESKTLLIDFHAKWIDRLSEKGESRMYWRVNLKKQQTSAIIDPGNVREELEGLDDPYGVSVWAKIRNSIRRFRSGRGG